MALSLYWKKNKDTKIFITNDIFIGETIEVEHKIMSLPSVTFTIPTETYIDSDIPDASFEFILAYSNGHIFHGIVSNIEIDHYVGVTTIQGVHIADELSSQRVPTNYALKEITLGEIYNFDTYIRPASLGTGEIISNQKVKENPTEDKKPRVTKTGNKKIDRIKNADGSQTTTTTYEMSDGSSRVVTSHVVKEVYGKNNYKKTTTVTKPDGTVVVTVVNKNGYGSSSTEVNTTKAEAEKEDKKEEDDNISQSYVDIGKLDGMFNSTDWTYKFVDDSDDIVITYLFSNQDKLQALTDICKQTENVMWRVSITEERTIEIGRFGEYKQFMITETNMLGDNLKTINDFTSITNYGIYFTDKSDSGTTALTLRDVYNNPYLQNPEFPIIVTGQEVNTERNYSYIDLIPFGSNNNGDYAVLDKEGLALEAGNIYEEAFTSNDVQTVAENNRELTNVDRLIASRQLYTQAVRKLIHSRRKIGYVLTVNNLTSNHNVGDKVRVTFVDELLKVTKCTNYFKKLMTRDDYFYISSLKEVIGIDGFMFWELTLEKFLYNDSEV